MKKTISPSNRFRRDLRKILKSGRGSSVQSRIEEIFHFLERGQPLPPRYRDHALAGEWSDHRDCHIFPDLLLLYRDLDVDTIELARIGSHSELFG